MAVEFVTAVPDGAGDAMLVIAAHEVHRPWEQRLWWWAQDSAWSHVDRDGGALVLGDLRHAPPPEVVAAAITQAMRGDTRAWTKPASADGRPPLVPHR